CSCWACTRRTCREAFDAALTSLDDRRILESTDGDLRAEVARIADEFLEGFETVARIDPPAVTLFGSARVGERSRPYREARAVARRFAPAGWAVLTGGGPRLMGARTGGTQGGGSLSGGLNVRP